jgi:hypothetical protein
MNFRCDVMVFFDLCDKSDENIKYGIKDRTSVIFKTEKVLVSKNSQLLVSNKKFSLITILNMNT